MISWADEYDHEIKEAARTAKRLSLSDRVLPEFASREATAFISASGQGCPLEMASNILDYHARLSDGRERERIPSAASPSPPMEPELAGFPADLTSIPDKERDAIVQKLQALSFRELRRHRMTLREPLWAAWMMGDAASLRNFQARDALLQHAIDTKTSSDAPEDSAATAVGGTIAVAAAVAGVVALARHCSRRRR